MPCGPCRGQLAVLVIVLVCRTTIMQLPSFYSRDGGPPRGDPISSTCARHRDPTNVRSLQNAHGPVRPAWSRVLVLREADAVAVRVLDAELQVAPRLVPELADVRDARRLEFASEGGRVVDVDLDAAGARRTVALE